MNFKIGDRVGRKEDAEIFNRDEETEFGAVVDLTTKGLVIVRWDYDEENSKPLDPSKLMLEADIEIAQSELEKNFDKYQGEIKAKFQEAIAVLEEAIKLADKAGCYVSDVVYKSEMQKVLRNAGWSGSSFAC